MKEILEGVYITDKGARVVLTEDNSRKEYYSVWVKKADDKKGKTVATRCTYQKAMQIAEEY